MDNIFSIMKKMRWVLLVMGIFFIFAPIFIAEKSNFFFNFINWSIYLGFLGFISGIIGIISVSADHDSNRIQSLKDEDRYLWQIIVSDNELLIRIKDSEKFQKQARLGTGIYVTVTFILILMISFAIFDFQQKTVSLTFKMSLIFSWPFLFIIVILPITIAIVRYSLIAINRRCPQILKLDLKRKILTVISFNFFHRNIEQVIPLTDAFRFQILYQTYRYAVVYRMHLVPANGRPIELVSWTSESELKRIVTSMEKHGILKQNEIDSSFSFF